MLKIRGWQTAVSISTKFSDKSIYGLYYVKQFSSFRKDKLAMVFQHFGLFTHRTVAANVEYGLEIKGVPKRERREKALEMLAIVGLDGWEDKYPGELSGGMQQRVGLARALANNPEILLMDEPFSALDPLIRREMQLELLEIQAKFKKTIARISTGQKCCRPKTSCLYLRPWSF